MRAKEGHKWTIVLTLPSGGKFVCGEHEGKLALVPIGDGTKEVKLNKVLAWDDSKEVSLWMKKLFLTMTSAEKEAFLRMKPDLGQVALTQ